VRSTFHNFQSNKFFIPEKLNTNFNRRNFPKITGEFLDPNTERHSATIGQKVKEFF